MNDQETKMPENEIILSGPGDKEIDVFIYDDGDITLSYFRGPIVTVPKDSAIRLANFLIKYYESYP